jgi:protein SCO1/2
MWVARALLSALLLTPELLLAHAGETHHDDGITTSVDTTSSALTNTNELPDAIANIGGPFSLTNHLGQPVTDQTYAGKHMLIFFGYSNCQIMCSISLKRIADALTILESDPNAPLSKLNPIVITVDPNNDTPAKLRESLASYHSALIGLTGTLAQLKPVYKGYQQKPSILDLELDESAVVSHKSYFYLMDEEGKLQTFFPPVLNAESMAKVIKKYLPI